MKSVRSVETVKSVKRRNLLILPVFFILIVTIVNFWSKTAPLLKPDEYDSFGKFLSFLQNPEIFQTVGSSFMIRYIPLSLIALWIIFLLQTFPKHIPTFYVLWTNWKYMILTTVAAIIWMLFAGFVQAYNLYYDPAGGMRPGLAGYFAHMAAGFGVTVILYNINLFDIFGLRGRRGRVIEVILILLIVLVIAFNYEYTEALHPERYYSELVDMRADVFSDIFGWSLGAALYQMIVPFEE